MFHTACCYGFPNSRPELDGFKSSKSVVSNMLLCGASCFLLFLDDDTKLFRDPGVKGWENMVSKLDGDVTLICVEKVMKRQRSAHSSSSVKNGFIATAETNLPK